MISQSDIATQIGISVDTLQNYKLLADMIPELEELVDTGIATPTTALAIMRNFPIETETHYNKKKGYWRLCSVGSLFKI